MEPNMLEHMIDTLREKKPSWADRKLAFYDPEAVQAKLDEVRRVIKKIAQCGLTLAYDDAFNLTYCRYTFLDKRCCRL
jgi:hypothetical protein